MMQVDMKLVRCFLWSVIVLSVTLTIYFLIADFQSISSSFSSISASPHERAHTFHVRTMPRLPNLATTQFGIVDSLIPGRKSTVCVDREALEVFVEQWMFAPSDPHTLPTSIAELRLRLSAQTSSRHEFTRKMRAITDDIDSSFTADDDVQLSPVPEHVRAIL
jgi:hypothetical protein